MDELSVIEVVLAIGAVAALLATVTDKKKYRQRLNLFACFIVAWGSLAEIVGKIRDTAPVGGAAVLWFSLAVTAFSWGSAEVLYRWENREADSGDDDEPGANDGSTSAPALEARADDVIDGDGLINPVPEKRKKHDQEE